mmetsp:Transcript_5209/g.8035  ORF Transcript_5209/g.8035 Transcript_5209/m.8035 type:complete len:112 (-) Transcript_5209:223-558(-)
MVVKKMACELMLVVPLFEVPAFTLWTGVFGRGQSPGEAFAQLQREWLTTVQAGWLVWGPASALTFRYVPHVWQLTVLYGVGAIWCCVISSLSFDPASCFIERARTSKCPQE